MRAKPTIYSGFDGTGKGCFSGKHSKVETSRRQRLFQVKAGDFVYNRLFAWKGSFAVVPDELDGCHVSAEFPVFDIDPSVALSEFINLVMCRPATWSIIEGQSTGSTAVSRNRWKEERFGNWELLLPPLRQQRAMIDLIRAVSKATRAAEAFAAVIGDASLGMLPEMVSGCDQAPLEDLVAIARAGGTPSRSRPEFYEGSIPWLKSGEVDNASIADTEEHLSNEGLASSSAWVVPSGYVVVAMYGATAGQVGRLRAAMATNQAVLAMIGGPALDTDFLFHLLRSRATSLKGRAMGAAQPNLSKARVLEELVPLLPIDGQKQIAALLDAMVKEEACAKELSDALKVLRSSLLEELLSGRHEIPAHYDGVLTA